MNEPNLSFGMHCPNCNSTFGVMFGNGEDKCPKCGSDMVPAAESAKTIANASCKQCNSYFGLIPLAGKENKCPKCGGDLS